MTTNAERERSAERRAEATCEHSNVSYLCAHRTSHAESLKRGPLPLIDHEGL